MEQYDVSVVIPVYNCEEYIEKCVESIQHQNYAKLNKIQVILINDGSTDNSLKICNQIKNHIKDLSIEIITEKNSGVSSARNKGIKAAKGKYIMFLDADDYISENTISGLVDFFDSHYEEIELVTYPRYEVDTKKQTVKQMKRYTDCFEETRIYDIEKEFQSLVPTLNVIVKNLYDNNVLFDESLFFHEDTLYTTEIIMRNKKIGYVKDAIYYYRIYDGNTVNTKSNPLFSFEQYMSFFEKLVEKYKKPDGSIPRYIQSNILNTIKWRLTEDKLYPYYLEGEEYTKAIERIKNIVSKIDNVVIVSDKQVDRYHKLYLLKQLKEIDFNIQTNHYNKYTINHNKDIIDVINNIEIVFNRFKVKNGKIYILAYLKSPLLQFKKPKLYIQYVTKKTFKQEEIEIKDSTANLHKAKIEVAKFYRFEYEIDMEKVLNFNFVVEIDNGVRLQVKNYFNTYAAMSQKSKIYTIYDGIYRVENKKNKFLISKPNRKERIKDHIKIAHKMYRINPKLNFFRFFAKTNKKIWIYSDRVGVFDNAYIQFKHDLKIKDGIKRYYALDGNIHKCKDKFNGKERKHVLKFGSLKHKILFMKSDKIITSFSNLQEYCPLSTNFQYYKDVFKYDLIYLQHGVLHATYIKTYSKEFTPIDKILISSEFERDNFINKYKYSEKDLICTEMPRFDEQVINTTPENKIIFAPSWRYYLMGKMVDRKRSINKDKFMKSTYYKEIIKFLTDEKLLTVLNQNNLIIDFKLHPIFEPYKNCFNKIINKNITVSIGNTDLTKYKAFITDFSSFQFDYVNIGRPIIYFVPDMKEFKAGLHAYRELDLKHEDAFGKLCLTGTEAVNEVTKLINNNFQMEPIYKRRMDTFFFKVKNRKDELYKALIKE